jgi:serine/threonine protein phosphatase PrpC
VISKIEVYQQEQQASDRRNENHLFSSPREKVLILSDGLGGATHGKQAAELVCESVLQFLVHEAGDLEATLPFVMRNYFSLAGNVLFNAVVHANRILLNVNSGKSVFERGGASVIAGFLDEGIFSVASVGACVGWFAREGRLQPLLTPRTWGRLKDPSAPGRGLASQLPLMALGVSEDLEPEVVDIRVRPGDRIWFGSFEPTPEELEGWLLSAPGTDAEKNCLETSSYNHERTWVLWAL